jgi:hypothetical protein
MAPNGKGSSKGSGKVSVGKKPGQVLAGPRKPRWTCSCGNGANWASRVSCYECDRAPPAATLKLARENAAKHGGGNSRIGKGRTAAKEEEEFDPELGKPAKDLVDKLRVGKEGEVVPFKRNLQQALLHKRRVEARVQQANVGLEDLLRRRQELEEEIERMNKRVEEKQGQLVAAEEEVKALMAESHTPHAADAFPGGLWHRLFGRGANEDG